MRPRTFVAALTLPMVPMALLRLWVELHLPGWLDQGVALSPAARVLLSVSNFVTRYGYLHVVPTVISAPILSFGLFRIVELPDREESQTDYDAALVSSLGRWLLATALTTAGLGALLMFSSSQFGVLLMTLGWFGAVCLVLAYAYAIEIQRERFRTGRSRMGAAWLVVIMLAVDWAFYPIPSFLLALGIYIRGRYELRRGKAAAEPA